MVNDVTIDNHHVQTFGQFIDPLYLFLHFSYVFKRMINLQVVCTSCHLVAIVFSISSDRLREMNTHHSFYVVSSNEFIK